MSDQDTTTPAPVEEVWTYLGVRLERDGRLEHHWQDDAGDVKIFDKLKAFSPGSRYRVRVYAKPDGGVSVGLEPRFVEQLPDEAKRRAIVAEHRANEVAAEAWRAAKKETTEAIDRMTVAELRAKLRRLPATRKRALLAIVIDRLETGKVE